MIMETFLNVAVFSLLTTTILMLNVFMASWIKDNFMPNMNMKLRYLLIIPPFGIISGMIGVLFIIGLTIITMIFGFIRK
jgi:hypothetical protein